jgi:hypothetical protein
VIKKARSTQVWSGSVIQVSTPGHAHEITWSVYRKKHFGNPDAGEFFLNELVTALTILSGISLFQKKGTNRWV